MREILRSNETIVKCYDAIRKAYYQLYSDEKMIKKRFKKRLDREVELNNPIKYNDKLQWLKLNWYDPIAARCADKYEVREIIKEKIGESYLNELIAVYESVEDIDLDKLPSQFVLKATHGSGYNIICKDKYTMRWDEEFKKMRRWLRTNYYLSKREWVYKDIKPRIICEKYLLDENGEPPKDYKIFCFNGEPKLVQVDIDRFNNHRRNFYTLDWRFVELEIKYPSDKSIEIPKPEALDEMIELSRLLSSDFPHVRVDFYYIKNKIIFGELTFFHGSGFEHFRPEEFEIEMGSWLQLPNKGS